MNRDALISDITECLSSPCLNGGICSEPQLDMYECNCTNTGYQDQNCQTGNLQIKSLINMPCTTIYLKHFHFFVEK